ncbi:DUF4870 domain-containing protein [Kineococcus sp. SYSU DK004]|uniref:DUF4870 domain-containing protein n=1 Tax=Kineococcus sp. SYSU DK004 TaxID=3383125 RepID=UPI003D7C4C0E
MSDPYGSQRPDFTKPSAGDQPAGQQWGQSEQQHGGYGQQHGGYDQQHGGYDQQYGQGYGQQYGQGYGQQQHPQWSGRTEPYGAGGLAAMDPGSERTWALAGHLSWLAAWLVGLPFLGPLIVFLVFKDRSRFVREHSAEALNLNIAMFVYSVVLGIATGIATIVTLGIGAPLIFLAGAPYVVGLVFSILAAVAASQGRAYRYPGIFRLVR